MIFDHLRGYVDSRKLLKTPTQASPFLYRIMRGHAWDLKLQSVSTVCSILQKLAVKQDIHLTAWARPMSGWTGVLRKGFRDLGWTEVNNTWAWRHELTNQSFALMTQDPNWTDDLGKLRHMLRESWRCCMFQKWLQQNTVDSNACQGSVYHEKRLAHLRFQNLTSHELAVVTGASVSPARYRKMNVQSALACPWCNTSTSENAGWLHVAWDCAEAPRPANVSLHACYDALQKRLGWPTGIPDRASLDHCILQWLAAVRNKCLHERHEVKELRLDDSSLEIAVVERRSLCFYLGGALSTALVICAR